MRISDWSSDVCSSDLIGQRLPKFVNRNHHALACQERVYPLEQVEHDRRADFRVFEEVGHIEAHETGFERHGIRSEEHTSELQSLMRISYAVFCLKKKKHQKQHMSVL